MAAIDKERWQRLSPLLDELLDLAAPERAARLAELRTQDPTLAAELLPLLEQQQALEGSSFLAAPPQLLDEVLTRLEPGQQIGAYTLERELGRGGMGTVWLARRTDGRFEGQVAIKLLSNGLFGGSPGEAARFAREGQILARLSHPHIARLLDAGLTDPTRQPYLVLEYVDGAPITRYCEQQQLGLQARVTLFLDVLAAVAHAHNRLILHRDLKPSNIMVDQGGAVKLLDFGIAKLLGDATQAEQGAAATELTRQAGRAFTPQYAAPEQVQGGDVTTATDVYALGVLLYVLLSGAHPTPGRTKSGEQASALEQMRELVEVAPRRVSEQAARSEQAAVSASARLLRGDLDTIVAKALKKTPAERYANAEALAQDLRRWLAHEPISARPDSRLYVLGRFLRRHRLAVGAGSAAMLAIAAGAGIAVWQAKEAQEQRVQAEGLIEFMLGDLRKKLDPVGRLDVLDAVGEKALTYYSRQDLGRSDADALGRRARALHLMGEIAEKRGKMSEAEQRFQEAAETTAELLARDPKNTQRLFDHAQSSYWVGYAAWRQGKREVAQPRFEDYLRLAQALVQLEPGKAEWQMEVAHAEVNLGVLLLRSGNPTLSILAFDNARVIWTKLAEGRIEARNQLGQTLGWLAEAQEALGQFDASIASLQAKMDLLAPDSQQDRRVQRLAAATQLALGRLLLNAGRTDAAQAATAKAEAGFTSLLALDPDNLELMERLAFVRAQSAEAALSLQQDQQAQATLRALAPLLARLLEADASKPVWRLQLQGRYLAARCQLAAQQTSPDATATRQALGAFLSNATAGSTADNSPEANTRWALALASLRLGDAWVARQPALARKHYEAVLLQLAPLGEQTGDLRVKSLRAHALLRLGRTQEARALAESLEASAYRHPEWQAELARRLGAAPDQSTRPTINSP
ncbi:serine/threonine-protein kinase [Roseateles sp.]|jgi:serine/threonine-protein kinase|uniref:serine/threonine-protein kinase n=1 Tax=Roseateles sp. TaxID=1971397 RepID=UPI0037CBC6EA